MIGATATEGLDDLADRSFADDAPQRDAAVVKANKIVALLASEREASSRRVEELEAALRPFAAVADLYEDHLSDAFNTWSTLGDRERDFLTLGVLRRARAALNAGASSKGNQV